ncbi:MAG TPA: hypothetical protein ENN74_00875 [Firmicutes bacterium]|nr:hypothetical protein [Bacillota bacterium]
MRPVVIGVLASCLAIVPVCAQPVPGVDVAPFGAQTVWPDDANLATILDRMHEAGIQWARFDLCWWGLCEQVPGVYNFTSAMVPGHAGPWNTDNAIAMLRARGIEPFPILCYGNSLYDGGQGPYSEEGRTAFGNYCYAAASRYRDSVSYWEIWNEPNLEFFWGRAPHPADYARLAIVAATRIRQANPDAVVAGGATSGIDLGFLGAAFDYGLLDAVDAITVHPYRIAAPETIDAEIATLRSMIASRTSRPVQVWTGEWGYNTYWSELTPLGQAKCLGRMMVNNFAQDIRLSIWFSTHAFLETAGNTSDPEWGLLDFAFQPRPSHQAMKVVNERLGAPVQPVEDPLDIALSPVPSGQRVRVFERGDSAHLTVVLWLARWPLSDSFSGRTTSVSLTAPPGTALAAYDGLSGDPVPLNVSHADGRTVLSNFRVMDYPTYLEIDLSSGIGEVEPAIRVY